MRIRCPDCSTVMDVNPDGLTPGKKAQVTCRCGTKCRFTVPEPARMTTPDFDRWLNNLRTAGL